MKSVLNYFVRKAFGFKSTATAEDKTLFGHLLRIKRNIQGVYDWLYPKLCGSADGTILKRMPMTEAVTSADGHEVLRPVLQNSDNLLAHLALLNGRKISNGYADGTPADDGLPDGVSLARILCDSSLQPTALIDDNVGWVMDKTLTTSATKVSIGCDSVSVMALDGQGVKEVYFPHLKSARYGSDYVFLNNLSLDILECPALEETSGINLAASPETITLPSLQRAYIYSNAYCFMFPNTKVVNLPNFDFIDYVGNSTWIGGNAIEEINMPKFRGLWKRAGWPNIIANLPNLRKVVFGKVDLSVTYQNNNDGTNTLFSGCPNLLHFEIGEGTAVSMNIPKWSPTLDSSNLSLFLDNFLHFIAERVAEGNYTLTLSAAVYAALEQQEGQTILALLNTKGWTVAQA